MVIVWKGPGTNNHWGYRETNKFTAQLNEKINHTLTSLVIEASAFYLLKKAVDFEL